MDPIYEYVKGQGWVPVEGRWCVIFKTPGCGWRNVGYSGLNFTYQETCRRYQENIKMWAHNIKNKGWEFNVVPYDPEIF